MKHYDEILIGSGPGAYTMSNLLAKTDHQVLVVEGVEFGGTCPNYGCEPKTFLEGAVRNVLQSQQLFGRGVSRPATLDWSQLMKTKLNRFDPWPAETRDIIAKTHDIENGYAEFLDDHTIQVNGHKYQADHIIIATGQAPNILSIPGKEYLHTSFDVLSLKQLPSRITFIGAGFVSLELATLVAAAGAEVTIVVHSDRVLRNFPHADNQQLFKAMSARGIKFLFATNTEAVKKIWTGFQLVTDQGTLSADYVVDATGRHPNVERLHLERTGIKYDHGGINVDDHLMTTVPGVFAIGDVVQRPQPKLTPGAEFEGRYLFNYLTGQEKARIEYPTIGRAAFTYPQVACVGVNPDQVADDKHYVVKQVPMQYGSLFAGENDQYSRLTLVFKGHRLAGVSAIGSPAADEVNHLFPVIGLRLTGKAYRQNVMAIYPALGDQVNSLLEN